MKKLLFLLIITVAGVYLYSCRKESNGVTPLFVTLRDAPTTVYDSVMIDVQGVEIKNNGGATILLNAEPGVYNLLDYANGNDTLIASDTVPSITISQVRLILGPNNYVVVGGVRYDLKTPSAQESGLKLNVHATLEPNIPYMMKLDFDASKSIVETGNGSFSLKPVIKVVTI